MASLNDDAQWIILMGFIVSIIIFILALIVSQSTLVGQTTSESVLEFSKTEIQDLRSEVMFLKEKNIINDQKLKEDLGVLSLGRKTAVVHLRYDSIAGIDTIFIHFNDGTTSYSETYDEINATYDGS